MKKDTIAAIATALSNSGISIIRVSGPDCIELVDQIFYNKAGNKILHAMKSHTIRYGFIKDDDKILDEVMVSLFLAPHSFTTEDTVEINCHGGIFVTKKILELVLKKGARLAEPGEFTKRAFLNGRIDLTKAEAVMDLIEAKSESALQNSISQLNGKLYSKIVDIRSKIIYEIAFIESAIDDPEHISLEGYSEKLAKNVDSIKKEMNHLLEMSETGSLIKDGINTVIVGKPNVGKSSILNILSGYEKAIVTDIAGTTRDVVEEKVQIGDIYLNLFDTAGIRNADNIVEQIGVERAKQYAEDAELIIYVIDSSQPLNEEDEKITEMIKNKKCIVLLNKSDLMQVVNKEKMQTLFHKQNIDIIHVSAKTNEGMDEFRKCIMNMFFRGKISFENEIYISSVRQKESLKEAYDSLLFVMDSIEKNMPEDFYSIDLMNAYSCLGKMIGEEVEDDLVEEIFSKFCMGK